MAHSIEGQAARRVDAATEKPGPAAIALYGAQKAVDSLIGSLPLLR
ncbi:hypothetical protein [Streptomyces dubilierae]|uniref:Uncharacterized protein n=1 Tax=Streptomyces dubilierae TaxID=3075533 RepID=A0ABU2P1R1_9ACTN|nr:hypothetical protein [Streptomyces sp. DSM 41921]MDT0386078.1 hypothetical protein [Streptomyces sp. DSM 41921]